MAQNGCQALMKGAKAGLFPGSADAAFRAEALRLAGESRSTQAAARALNINPKLLYKWQKAAQTPAAAALGAGLDPATAAELRQLRALSRRRAQELEILKKPSPPSPRRRTNEPLPLHRRATGRPSGAVFVPGAGRGTEPLSRLAAGPAAGRRGATLGLGNGTGRPV